MHACLLTVHIFVCACAQHTWSAVTYVRSCPVSVPQTANCTAQVEAVRAEGPTVRYVDGPNGVTLSFPEGFAFPLASQKGPPEWYDCAIVWHEWS